MLMIVGVALLTFGLNAIQPDDRRASVKAIIASLVVAGLICLIGSVQ